jgi:hypothetical protein
MSQNVITGRYEPVHEITATFEDGSLPGWLNSSVSGAGSVTTSSANLGRATLNTGTTQSDFARIRGDASVTPADFDAVGYRCRFELNSGAASGLDAVVVLGLQDATDSSILVHLPNHNVTNRIDSVESANGANTTGTFYDTRAFLQPNTPVTTELFYDSARGEALHRYQGAFSRQMESEVPDPSLALEPDVFIQNSTDGTERVVTVYELTVTCYNRLR